MMTCNTYNMQKSVKVIVLMVALSLSYSLSFGVAAAADLKSDTLSIRFRVDSVNIDMDYGDNARAWESFERNFRDHYSGVSPQALSLDIYSGASPEGTAAHNRWLGESRGLAIHRLVRQRLGGSVGSVIVHNEAARWDGLYEAVASSDEPWRDEVLGIIELPASHNENLRDHREQRLRQLRGGKIWPVLLEKYLAPLRSGATAVLSWKPDRDTIVVLDTVFIPTPVYPSDLVFVDSAGDFRRIPDSTKVYKPVERQAVWILRTNVPLLGFGATPNLQAEWSLGHKDKWSINAELIWPWWIFSHNAYANQVFFGGVELRRWLGRRWRHHTLDGWHIGLAAGGGYYDLEWKSKGYQGEALMTYINIGWQRRFGKRRQWAFDAGIGVGYLYTPSRRYTGSSLFPDGHEEHYDDHLMWQETNRLHWFATPHANVSIGYCWPQRDARWKRQKALERDAEIYAYQFERDSVLMRERFVRDSTLLEERMALKEAKLLPKDERKAKLKEMANRKKRQEKELKAVRKQARIDARNMERQERETARDMKLKARREKAERDSVARAVRQADLDYLKSLTPEEKERVETERKQQRLEERRQKQSEKRQAASEEKAARKQAKAVRKQAKVEAKAARKQAKADQKLEKKRARIESVRKRKFEKLERKSAPPAKRLDTE